MTMNTDVQANAVATIDEASDSDMLSFESLLEAYDYDMPRRGEILKGLILEVTNDQIILDVGTKHDAIVPRKDLERLEDELLDRLQPGAEMAVYVLRPLTADGELLVSINKALTMEDWDRAIELEASDEMIEVEVVGEDPVLGEVTTPAYSLSSVACGALSLTRSLLKCRAVYPTSSRTRSRVTWLAPCCLSRSSKSTSGATGWATG